MKVNSYKKGTCPIILLKYVIVNMYNEFKKKKKKRRRRRRRRRNDDRSQNHCENSKLIGSIVFWSVQFTVPVY